MTIDEKLQHFMDVTTEKVNAENAKQMQEYEQANRPSSSSLVRIRGSPISRSQTLPSRNLRRSPGNMVWIMR